MMIYSWRQTGDGNRVELVSADAINWLRAGPWAVVRNTVKNLWHIVDYETGAIIATGGRQAEMVRLMRRLDHVKVRQQLATFADMRAGAQELPAEEFFGMFQERVDG